jgi:hypothetical protein
MPDLDPQSWAFREATESDAWDGNIVNLLAEGGAYHEPITDLTQLRLPEHHEADGWDAGREAPKTVVEAREALAARIADPSAPDAEDHAGAYDDLDND